MWVGEGEDNQFRQKFAVGKMQARIFSRHVSTLDHVTSVHCIFGSGELLPTIDLQKQISTIWYGGLHIDWIFTSSVPQYIILSEKTHPCPIVKEDRGSSSLIYR